MKVRVYPPAFVDASILDREGYLELVEGATLDEVFKALKIGFPLKHFLLCFVNYERVKLSAPLRDGDEVSFFALASGG